MAIANFLRPNLSEPGDFAITKNRIKCSNSANDAKCPSRPDGSRLAVRRRYSLSQFVDFGVRDIPPESIGTRAPRPIKARGSGHRSWFAQHRDNPGRIGHLNATDGLKSVPLVQGDV